MRVKGKRAERLLQGINLVGKLLKRLLPKHAGAPPNLNHRSPMAGMPPGGGPAHDIREQADRARKRRSKGYGLD